MDLFYKKKNCLKEKKQQKIQKGGSFCKLGLNLHSNIQSTLKIILK